MRKVAGLIVVVATLLAGSAVPASAAQHPAAGLNRRVSGPFTGATSFDFGAPNCSFAHQVYDATYTTTRQRSGSFHIDGCAALTNPFQFTGTFTLTTPHHATLWGSVAGTIASSSTGACKTGIESTLAFTLTVDKATKAFAKATGTIALQGIWCSSATPNVKDPVNGTLTGHLTR